MSGAQGNDVAQSTVDEHSFRTALEAGSPSIEVMTLTTGFCQEHKDQASHQPLGAGKRSATPISSHHLQHSVPASKEHYISLRCLGHLIDLQCVQVTDLVMKVYF